MFKALSLWADRKLRLPAGWGLLMVMATVAVTLHLIASLVLLSFQLGWPQWFVQLLRSAMR